MFILLKIEKINYHHSNAMCITLVQKAFFEISAMSMDP